MHRCDDEKVVIITSTFGKYFLWNEEDVLFLRTKHRICGAAIGSLPRKPWQNNYFSLPVLLMPEEVYVCILKGFAHVLEPRQSYFKYKGNIQNKTEHDKQKCKIGEEQIKIFKRNRMEKSKLYYGRAKTKKESKTFCISTETALDKSTSSIDQEKSTENEVSDDETVKMPSQSNLDNPEDSPQNVDTIIVTEEDRKYYDHSIRVHLPTSADIKKEILEEQFNRKYPSTENQIRFTVYTDLWGKGYYVTSAEKFGGDFLVYPGDPLRFHSNFIVVILEKNESLKSKQMIYYGRLGSSVKKTVCLASVCEKDNSVTYNSLQWTTLR